MKGKILMGIILSLAILGATAGAALAQSTTDTPVTTNGTPTITATAQTATTDTSGAKMSREDAFVQKLAIILGIDKAKVKDAVDQARREVVRDEFDARVKAKLDKLVASGKLTQAEADEIYAWVQARPASADKLFTGEIMGLHIGRGHGDEGLHLGLALKEKGRHHGDDHRDNDHRGSDHDDDDDDDN